MPSSLYTAKLTDHEILDLVKQGMYAVDLELGVAYSRKGTPLALRFNPYGHPFVWLYKAPKRRRIPLAHLVWIVGNDRPLPRGFQVHHDNQDKRDARFTNLFALSIPDHRKLHDGRRLIDRNYQPDEEEEVPF